MVTTVVTVVDTILVVVVATVMLYSGCGVVVTLSLILRSGGGSDRGDGWAAVLTSILFVSDGGEHGPGGEAAGGGACHFRQVQV